VVRKAEVAEFEGEGYEVGYAVVSAVSFVSPRVVMDDGEL
jgi:hypothetical protein